MSRKLDWERRSRIESAAVRAPRKRKIAKALSPAEEERRAAVKRALAEPTARKRRKALDKVTS